MIYIMQGSSTLRGRAALFGRFNPAIAPRPSAVGDTVAQRPMGGRDVAPIGVGLPVPRALPVGLH